MIVEALSWYVESISAFWVSLASGGLVKLILICCFIYWICCRRRGLRWRCYSHCCTGHGGHGANCECRCGGCACGVEEAGAEPEDAAEAAGAGDAEAAV